MSCRPKAVVNLWKLMNKFEGKLEFHTEISPWFPLSDQINQGDQRQSSTHQGIGVKVAREGFMLSGAGGKTVHQSWAQPGVKEFLMLQPMVVKGFFEKQLGA